MIKYFHASNGIGYDETGNNGDYLNAHLSYKGRSIIIDYEFYLHSYDTLKSKDNKFVPFEMYPYGGDIYVDYVPLDERFGKADISKLIEIIDKALENEPEPIEWKEESK